jgi:hypothetical protein
MTNKFVNSAVTIVSKSDSAVLVPSKNILGENWISSKQTEIANLALESL